MITEALNSYITILLVGSLMLLSFLLISNPLGVNKKANLYLGIFTLLWSTFWIDEVLGFINLSLTNEVLRLLLRFVQFFTPILFYYGISYFTYPNLKLGISNAKHLILPLLFLLALLYQSGIAQNNYLEHILVGLLLTQSICFTILSWIKLNKHSQRIELFSSNKEEIDLKWLKQIIKSLIALCVFIGLYNILFQGKSLNLLANSIMLISVFFIAYHTIRQKEIFVISGEQIDKIIAEEGQEEGGRQKLISDFELSGLKQELIHIMKADRPYLESDLSLQKLAGLMDLSPHQLSYVLNEGFNENFYHFVNKYRVETAKAFLLREDYNYLSVLGIAYEAGFNSKTTFNTVFKKFTATTPTAYKKRGSL